MNRAAVRILHATPLPGAGPLEHWLAAGRSRNAARLAAAFAQAGAQDVEIVSDVTDGAAFGTRLRRLTERFGDGGASGTERRPAGGGGAGLDHGDGLVILGSGSVPLARAADLAPFVALASSGERRALTNNRYSADIVALGRADLLAAVPNLPGDNALPRWLEEVAGVRVDDLRRRPRLAMDLDSPLDLLLVEGRGSGTGRDPDLPASIDLGPVRERMAAVRRVARDRTAELLVAGRTSAGTIRWLERASLARIRALVEERGLRAASPDAHGVPSAGSERRSPRSPRSVLGHVLDDRGPDALGEVVGELGDAAILDTRVLLAHRLGADERGWPGPEDRFASDLLLPDRIEDPWLRALTASALRATIPILLGGHSLVGPGIPLLLSARRGR